MNGSTPTRSNENCLDTYVVATVFSYDESTMLMAKLNFPKHHPFYIPMLANICMFFLNSGRVTFNYQKVPALEEYLPFSENVDIEGRLAQFCGTQDID